MLAFKMDNLMKRLLIPILTCLILASCATAPDIDFTAQQNTNADYRSDLEKDFAQRSSDIRQAQTGDAYEAEPKKPWQSY